MRLKYPKGQCEAKAIASRESTPGVEGWGEVKNFKKKKRSFSTSYSKFIKAQDKNSVLL